VRARPTTEARIQSGKEDWVSGNATATVRSEVGAVQTFQWFAPGGDPAETGLDKLVS